MAQAHVVAGRPMADSNPSTESQRPILIVEDDPDTVRLVRLYLERDGHSVIEAGDGIDGLQLALTRSPRLVVLDIMLPGMDGIAVCEKLRAESDVPIIMLTARVDESDRLTGLDSGADDYVTKPFSPRELAARIRAVLRRAAPKLDDEEAPTVQAFGPIELDMGAGSVKVAGEMLRFTATEMRLLSYLMLNNGQILSRDRIIEKVLGFDYDGMDRTVDTHISNIRRKLEKSSGRRFVHTVYGMGYRFGDA
ncbi:MAG: response regulator transcription factor [Dehalococcoidia bacterium]|nr:response regulator transcription factor [Dehalococcoidia bacterium]